MAYRNSVLFFSIFVLNLLLHTPLMTLSFNFSIPSIGSDVKSSFNLFGEAQISSNGLFLTPKSESESENNKVGRATYSKLLHLWDSGSRKMADFNTHFSFVIESNSAFYGEGLAFFLADSKSIAANNSPGGYMGLIGNASSPTQAFVAIEFDTNWSDLWDPDIGPHVGIDINNITSSKAIHWNSLANIRGQEMDAWIIYDATSYKLEVYFRVYNSSSHSFITKNLTYEVDLRDFLPEYVAIGFTASTGAAFTQVNYVKSWDFAATLSTNAPFIDQAMESNSQRRGLQFYWPLLPPSPPPPDYYYDMSPPPPPDYYYMSPPPPPDYNYMSPPPLNSYDDASPPPPHPSPLTAHPPSPPTLEPPPPPPPPSEQLTHDESSTKNKGLIIGLTAAITLAVIACVVGCFLWQKKQTDNTEAGGQGKEPFCAQLMLIITNLTCSVPGSVYRCLLCCLGY